MDKQQEFKYYYAFTLGDGCLEKSEGNRNSRLRIEHITKNLDYCEWKYKILSQLTKVTLTTYTREDRQQSFTRLITERHPRYTTIRNRMYLNGHKTIDPHIESFIDWEFLAIVYQDDGSLSFNQNNYPQVILCLESFSWAELKMFRDWLAKKLNLHWNVVRKTGKNAVGYRLRLTGKQIPEFFDGIRPFVVESMKYKLQLPEREAPEMDEDIVRSI